MPKKKEKSKTRTNEQDNNIARVLTQEEYEQRKKEEAKLEKTQYTFKTRFKATVLTTFLGLPIVIGILGLIPVIGLLFNFKISSLIIFIIWGIIAYIGFLVEKYLPLGNKELWDLIDRKDNPKKYKKQ